MKAKEKDKELNPKQKRFCIEYVVDFNGQQAAIRAGYAKKGADTQASRMLTYAKVKEEVERLTEQIKGKLSVKVEDVVAEIKKIAFFDVGCMLDEDNNFRNINDLKPEERAAISEVKISYTKEGKSIAYKTNSKVHALEMLCKHLGMYAPTKSELIINDVSSTGFRLKTNAE